MVIASIIMLCSLLGLPWYVASPVRSLMHVRSLMKESEIRIPGEHPKLIGIRYDPYLINLQIMQVFNETAKIKIR